MSPSIWPWAVHVGSATPSSQINFHVSSKSNSGSILSGWRSPKIARSDRAANRLFPTPFQGQSVGAQGTCWIIAGHTVKPRPTTRSRYAARSRYSRKSDIGAEAMNVGTDTEVDGTCVPPRPTGIRSGALRVSPRRVCEPLLREPRETSALLRRRLVFTHRHRKAAPG